MHTLLECFAATQVQTRYWSCYFYTMLKICNYGSIGTEYVPKYAILKFCDYASIGTECIPKYAIKIL